MADLYLLVECNGQFLALPATHTQGVLRAVAITPLPHSNEGIEGVINLRGQTTPVISLRKLMGFPLIPLHPDHHFVILDAPNQPAALLVDRVHDLIPLDEEEATQLDQFSQQPLIHAVLNTPEGMILTMSPDALTQYLQNQKHTVHHLSGRPTDE